MLRPHAMFLLPNTTTLLARTAINLLKRASQDQLDEAIQTLINRRLPANGVMAHLEQNVHVAETLQKLAEDWAPETLRAFASALQMELSKTDVMDLIVAIAILNEPDLEAELRGENTTEPSVADLLENRRITWQYPPPGTPLLPPYVVLVAVEQVDTSKADGEVQGILSELVDYKGYKIGRRTPVSIRPGIAGIRPEILAAVTRVADLAAFQPGASQPAAEAPAASPAITAPFFTPPGMTIPGVTSPTEPATPAAASARATAVANLTRLSSALAGATRLRGLT